MANGISDLERGIAQALPDSFSLTPEGILDFAKNNPATVATGALSVVDLAGGLGRFAKSSTPIGILTNVGKALISGKMRDLLPFGSYLFPTEEELAAKELGEVMGGLGSAQPNLSPSQRNAVLQDYARNYIDPGTLQKLLGEETAQPPTTTGGLPPPSPVQSQPIAPAVTRGLPPPSPVGVASLGSPFAAPGVGIFGTPGYTDAADVYGESSPFGGMGAPDEGGDGDGGTLSGDDDWSGIDGYL